MNLSELQEKVMGNAMRFGEKHDIKIDVNFLLKKLYEEVGEFTSALLIHEGRARKQKLVPASESEKMLRNEIADVIGISIAMATKLNIDVEKALEEKGWFRKLEDVQ
ncbi:hypothetical protein A2765_05020 [Candidatus Kaiserbacteria bacterium RIFCSPHIGHO2_01_FULL_56_24]|uniref:NTP pyrophosphohydrolase MazG putative catalytic core domain-containing protein n=1 Tax=Candidatus Kaiserbacteria bacterium RIFCSPHIGHO2_01_FULL_56_24 TaxID=1798487 RepID=A0A1F6D8R5_9BACT|nr:MAG: hypothetical protein A2765_05020 [Candidatus Kaiserbacteria bacterium RIFCSPHIGHO2_01_FULL_56_24]